jgi:TRAP-type mannitol/chloroaromatic compound transport system permease small subunit
MLVSGWRFASDAIGVDEHSFTEWGIQYWPVKLMIPVGAALLILQGLSRLARDVAIVLNRREA